MTLSKLVLKRIWVLLIGIACCAAAWSQNMPAQSPHLANTPLHGQSRLRVIVQIYDVALYAPNDVGPESLYERPMALAVKVARGFRAQSILKQMVKELGYQKLSPSLIANYESQFAVVLSDVSTSDTLTGVYTPKQGWALWLNDRRIGQWPEDAFAKAFFDIWLGPNASQKAVRRDLLKLPS